VTLGRTAVKVAGDPPSPHQGAPLRAEVRVFQPQFPHGETEMTEVPWGGFNENKAGDSGDR
jgi:hypothetical protein